MRPRRCAERRWRSRSTAPRRSSRASTGRTSSRAASSGTATGAWGRCGGWSRCRRARRSRSRAKAAPASCSSRWCATRSAASTSRRGASTSTSRFSGSEVVGAEASEETPAWVNGGVTSDTSPATPATVNGGIEEGHGPGRRFRGSALRPTRRGPRKPPPQPVPTPSMPPFDRAPVRRRGEHAAEPARAAYAERVQIDVFTLFPHWFDWFRGQRHVANALALGSRLECVDYRAHTPLSAGQVDDTPFGGGAGMVLRVDVVEAALRARYGDDPVAVRARRRVIALTPGGRLLDDALAAELATEEGITLLCGRYEGFDERIVEHFCTEAVSIGRYVLAGGELPAMVVCDAILRKLPGALGHADSAVEESFSAALGGDPEYPHYTRPAEYRGWKVPEVLLSGHHEEIRQWRRARSRERGAAGGSSSLP